MEPMPAPPGVQSDAHVTGKRRRWSTQRIPVALAAALVGHPPWPDQATMAPTLRAFGRGVLLGAMTVALLVVLRLIGTF